MIESDHIKDLSLIEPSDSDTDPNAHYVSVISSSNKHFVEDFTFSNTDSVDNPKAQSSIIEIVNFEKHKTNINSNNNTSDVQKNENISEIIDLTDNETKNDKIFLQKPHNPIVIDLTKNEFDYSKKDVMLPVDNANLECLTVEKIKLEELMKHYTKNIVNMKVCRLLS